jgi:hypothetical protein
MPKELVSVESGKRPMPRVFIVSTVAVSLFVAGLLAGQTIVMNGEGSTRPPQSNSLPGPIQDPVVFEQSDNGPRHDAGSFAEPPFAEAKGFVPQNEALQPAADDSASSMTSISLTVTPDSELTLSGNNEFMTAEVNAPLPPMAPDAAAVQRTLEIVRRIFPDAEPDTAQIWAEEYADVALEEAEFLLEQKRELSEQPGIPSFLSTANRLIGMPPTPVTMKSGLLDSALLDVQSNLRSMWAVGHRSLVVLPTFHAADTNLVGIAMTRMTTLADVVRYRSFRAGRMIASPVATHVALPDDQSLMFCLEGNRLTRRGDFTLLSSRRLGIRFGDQELPLKDSPVVPDAISVLRIDFTGMIESRNSSGQRNSLGRIAVARIESPGQLHSTDGIFFSYLDSNVASPAAPGTFALAPGTLELSNGDVEEARMLQSELERLRAE